MIPKSIEAEILRLYHAEKLPKNTIAAQLGVHHTVVTRVLESEGLPALDRPRPSKLDQYVSFIQTTFEKYPSLCASRLYNMSRERGYRGSESYFRRFVRRFRPKPVAEAYLRTRTLPGEQAQVDWGHFGTLQIGQATRKLVAFVMVLSYSRRVFLRFYLGMCTENFLHGHVAAFEHWGGCPRNALYDNLKSAVLERRDSVIRFNPLLLALASTYRLQLYPVAVARGNEKGRVERAIRYIRDSFFSARKFTDLNDLNRQALEWCDGIALERPCPEDKSRTVGEVFEEEKGFLLPLPEDPFPTDERKEVAVGKTPYIRFDLNDYSVPHQYVRRVVTVEASLDKVRIFADAKLIAEHRRSFDRGAQIENPAHIQALVEKKKEARKHRGFDRLHRAAPASYTLFQKLAERGENLGSATNSLLNLLAEFGSSELQAAIEEVVSKDVPRPSAVRQILDRRRKIAGDKPATPVHLPDDPRVKDLFVQSHNLDSYDDIASATDAEEEEESHEQE